jgi:hypothetical protein
MRMFAQTDLAKLAQEVGANAGNVCPMLIGFFLFILAMGIVLRTACSLFNSIVGGKDAAEGIPMPSLLGCMFLVLISYIVAVVLAGAVVWTATSLAVVTNLSGAQAAYYAGMASIPIAFIVLSIMLALFLPTPIFRAVIIAILCVPVAIVLFILFTVILWLIFAAIGMSHPALKLPWAQ